MLPAMQARKPRSAASAVATMLPRAPGIFVGRCAELERLDDCVAQAAVTIIVGLPGVGKSALAHAWAHRRERRVVYVRLRDGATLAELIADVRRQLGSAERAPAPLAAQLRDVAHRLDAARAVWLIDDLHRLSAADSVALLGVMAVELDHARVVATSRRRVRLPLGVDTAELRLDGLDRARAAELWQALDRLSGRTPPFDSAWPRARGNPLLLRQSHASPLARPELLSELVDRLDAHERRVCGALAVADERLPLPLLRGLGPARIVDRALERLADKLIIDLDDDAGLLLHDLVRDAVVARLTGDERRHLHRRLYRLVATSELDPVLRARQVRHHLVALGQWDALGRYLLRNGREIVRHGGVAELLRGFDAIPAAARSSAVAAGRARTIARACDLERAYAELSRLCADRRVDADLTISLAQICMLTARLDEAERVIRSLDLDAIAEPSLALRARMTAAAVTTHLGRGDEARAMLVGYRRAERDATRAAWIEAYLAFTLWLDERDVEAELHVARAASSLATAKSYHATRALPIALAATLARLGRLDDARLHFDRAAETFADSGDFLLQTQARAIRAMIRLGAGEHAACIDELSAMRADAVRGGFRLGFLWAGAWLGRALWLVGRRRQAALMLDQTAAQAAEHGAVAIGRACERGRVRHRIAVDERRHVVACDGEEVSLARRPVLRRLFYTLWHERGREVTKEALAEAIWQRRYNPVSDDGVIWVNVARLRRLLARFGILVHAGNAAYSLVVAAADAS